MWCRALIITFDLLTFNFYGISDIMRLNSAHNLSEIEYGHGWVMDDLARSRRAILREGAQLTELSQGGWTQHHETW